MHLSPKFAKFLGKIVKRMLMNSHRHLPKLIKKLKDKEENKKKRDKSVFNEMQ